MADKTIWTHKQRFVIPINGSTVKIQYASENGYLVKCMIFQDNDIPK